MAFARLAYVKNQRLTRGAPGVVTCQRAMAVRHEPISMGPNVLLAKARELPQVRGRLHLMGGKPLFLKKLAVVGNTLSDIQQERTQALCAQGFKLVRRPPLAHLQL